MVGTRYNRLAEAVLTSTHNLCFEQKYEKKILDFLSENFQFLIYLNRRVFVMKRRKYGLLRELSFFIL